MTTAISDAAATIKGALTDWGLPGTVIGITDRQHLLTTIVHGYADFKARLPLTEQARFAIGSISKSFTAAAVLQLVDEGRVDLHAPITRYLPGLVLASPFEPISVHHLLSHTSGLPAYLVHTASSRYVMAALRAAAAGYAPGTRAHYSNTGYQLLGYLIENLEGVSYASAIQRRILDPLGMTSSAGIIDHRERSAIVPSYERWLDGTYFEASWYEYAAADGSLISTVADMGAYARCILNRGVAASCRLLSEVAFQRWTTPVTDDGHAYGLYVSKKEGDVRVAHSGGIMGFHSLLDVHLDAGFAIVRLSNTPVPAELRTWIVDTITKVFTGGIRNAPPVRRKPAKVQDYAGEYHSSPASDDGSHKLECVVHNGSLWLKRGHELKQLECMGGDCFRLIGSHSDGLPFFFARADVDVGNNAPRGFFAGFQYSPSEGDRKVTDVSHGAKWYVREGLPEPRTAPEDYAAYVGHFESFCPEGPLMRIFVRDGQLWTKMSLSEEESPALLDPVGPTTFRFGPGHYDSELVQFDTVIEGRAMRLTLSGVPLHRWDTV